MTTNEREVQRQWANHTRRLNEAAATATIDTLITALYDAYHIVNANWADARTVDGRRALSLVNRLGEVLDNGPSNPGALDLADVLYAALVNLADVSALTLDMMRMGYDADAREHPDAPTVGERLAAALDDAGAAIARMERGQA